MSDEKKGGEFAIVRLHAYLELHRNCRAKINTSAIRDSAHLRIAQLHTNTRRTHLLRYLEEGVTRHILHPGMQLVHELEQLVHYSPQELPVRLQEPRVLSHHVHDVRRDDGLVVLSPLHLAQVQQILHTQKDSIGLKTFCWN